jgi:hypothetical protein
LAKSAKRWGLSLVDCPAFLQFLIPRETGLRKGRLPSGRATLILRVTLVADISSAPERKYPKERLFPEYLVKKCDRMYTGQ